MNELDLTSYILTTREQAECLVNGPYPHQQRVGYEVLDRLGVKHIKSNELALVDEVMRSEEGSA